jgi:trimeric autotransporter adhesin
MAMRIQRSTSTGQPRVARLAAGLALVTLPAGILAGASGHALAAAHAVRSAAIRATGPAAAGDISTIVGGVGGPDPATSVALQLYPQGVTFAGGSLYFIDAFVRKVNPRTDWLTTPVGAYVAGTLGFSYIPVEDGGPATKAGLCGDDLAVAPDGNLAIADTYDYRVRLVAAHSGTFYGVKMTAGHIYSVADADGVPGFSGDGGPATEAQVDFPGGVAVDGAGNIVVADTENERLRVIAASSGTFYGVKMTAGDIYTVAGNGKTGFSGDGDPATRAELNEPEHVTVDGAGNLLIADTQNDRVRVVAVKTGTFYGLKMTTGDIYTVAGNGTRGYTGDGGPALKAELDRPQGVSVDGAGNLLIADTQNDRVRVVAVKTGTFYGVKMTAGDIYTVAGNGTRGYTGDGGPALKAELDRPYDTTVDAVGNLVLSDTFNDRVRVVAVKTGTFYGLKMTAGDIYTIAGIGRGLSSGSGGPALKAEISLPYGVAVGSTGNVAVDDMQSNEVWVSAARSGTFYGVKMTAGDIYRVAGTGGAGFSGDGGPALKAKLNSPWLIGEDASGNLLVPDALNGRVRVVAAKTGTFYGQKMTTGDIYTVAGGGQTLGNGVPATKADVPVPEAVTVDHAGNLVITDIYSSRIRVVAASTGRFYGQKMTAGDIYTVAGNGAAGYSGDGGPATKASLSYPQQVAVDATGNLIVADNYNNRVRVVAVKTGTFYGVKMTAGDIYTVAGNGAEGYNGDGGLATKAELNAPEGVAADQAGNLVISDQLNNRVRVVAASTGTFYGQHMIVGHIYTVAGNGQVGFSGDGGPATEAMIDPAGITVNSHGDLIVVDQLANRVRMITGGPVG